VEVAVAKFRVYLGMCLKGLKEIRNIELRTVRNLAEISTSTQSSVNAWANMPKLLGGETSFTVTQNKWYLYNFPT